MTAIRRADVSDADSIASILNALLSSTAIEWRYEPYSHDAIREWMQAHECILVAEKRGEVVGLGLRSGVGQTLMRSLIDEARNSGKHSMIAAVDGANESSISFHERLGLQEVARMPEVGAKFGRWLELVPLRLRLDDRQMPDPD